MRAEKVRDILFFGLFLSLVAVIQPDAVAASNRFAPPDPALLEEFGDSIAVIESLGPGELQKGIRNSLIKQLESAYSAYERGEPCTAANILRAFLNHASGLVRGKKVPAAEGLRNRVWMLRHRLIASLPSEVNCPGVRNEKPKAGLKITASDNKGFSGAVSFGTPLLQTVEAAGEVWTQVDRVKRIIHGAVVAPGQCRNGRRPCRQPG